MYKKEEGKSNLIPKIFPKICPFKIIGTKEWGELICYLFGGIKTMIGPFSNPQCHFPLFSFVFCFFNFWQFVPQMFVQFCHLKFNFIYFCQKQQGERIEISKLISQKGTSKLNEMKRRPMAKIEEESMPSGIDLGRLPFKMAKGIDPKNVRRCQFNVKMRNVKTK